MRSHPVICPRGLSHFMLILWAKRLSKKFASLPNIPSVDTTKDVKDAGRASAATLYFLFLSCSAVESAATVL